MQAPIKRRRVPRTRILKQEARARLIVATISLCERLPFNEVSTRAICAEAGLNPSTILQQFGTLNALLAEAAKELVRRYAENQANWNGEPGAFSDPGILLRSRLVAWLLLKGYEPEHLRSDLIEDDAVMARQVAALKVEQRMAAAWSSLTTMVVEANAVFGPIHQLSNEDAEDVLHLVLTLRESLPAIEEKMGWSASQSRSLPMENR